MAKYAIYRISVNQLCRNRLGAVTDLSNTILLPIGVQVYQFHGRSEKLNNKKGCVGKFTEG